MSNNKQSMKLYTEIQVRTIIGKAQMLNWDDEFLFSEDYLISSLTPIELPSDEEIEEVGHNHQRGGYEWQNEKRKSFIEGIKYLIDKIQGGNK